MTRKSKQLPRWRKRLSKTLLRRITPTTKRSKSTTNFLRSSLLRTLRKFLGTPNSSRTLSLYGCRTRIASRRFLPASIVGTRWLLSCNLCRCSSTTSRFWGLSIGMSSLYTRAPTLRSACPDSHKISTSSRSSPTCSSAKTSSRCSMARLSKLQPNERQRKLPSSLNSKKTTLTSLRLSV